MIGQPEVYQRLEELGIECIALGDFIRYIDSTGNQYEWIKLY